MCPKCAPLRNDTLPVPSRGKFQPGPTAARQAKTPDQRERNLSQMNSFHNLSLKAFLPFKHGVRQDTEVTPSTKYNGYQQEGGWPMLTSDFSSRFGEWGSSYCFCYLSGRGLNDLKNHIRLMIFMSVRMMVEFQQKRKKALRVLFKTPLCFIFPVISHLLCEIFYLFIQLYFEGKQTLQIQALRRRKLPE